jgi:Xaa-Pro aminopeptidase
MMDIERLRTAIQREALAGWLFYNQHHRDTVADKILNIAETNANTRPWIYLLFCDREPVKLVHKIEDSVLDHLPGKKLVYSGREEFAKLLSAQAPPQTPLAADFSLNYPELSLLDHGSALFLERSGFALVSAERIIQYALSTLTPSEIRSHEDASSALHRIIVLVWERIVAVFRQGSRPLYEGEILDWIKELFLEFDLETTWPLIVGAGKNTTKPHYYPEGKGARLCRGEVLQLDIWGKKREKGSIYADISWSGILSAAAPPNVERVFTVVRDAREKAVEFIREKLARRETVYGAAVDAYCESILVAEGFGEYIRHRTGHAIDTEVHGFGVNLDSKEFPDRRALQEGSCFSVEPGLYLEDFGIRTEIDVYIENNAPVISGATPQSELLCFEE